MDGGGYGDAPAQRKNLAECAYGTRRLWICMYTSRGSAHHQLRVGPFCDVPALERVRRHRQQADVGVWVSTSTVFHLGQPVHRTVETISVWRGTAGVRRDSCGGSAVHPLSGALSVGKRLLTPQLGPGGNSCLARGFRFSPRLVIRPGSPVSKSQSEGASLHFDMDSPPAHRWRRDPSIAAPLLLPRCGSCRGEAAPSRGR